MNMPKDYACDYSVVIPVYNEVDNLRPLLNLLLPVLQQLGSHEIIVVDDGSTDGSGELLQEIHVEHPDIFKLIAFRRNLGKSAALDAGFRVTRGRFIVMMDADLQDQPTEITHLVEKLHKDKLDVVSGWKVNRQDPLNKTLPSRLFNWSLKKTFMVEVHDFNCGLKLMRAECIQSLILYGQLHRYMLVLLAHQGFSIGEAPVHHAKRLSGVSKYGWWRFLEGFMDLITIYFLTRYLRSPLYFFGSYALFFLLAAIAIGGFFLSMHIYAIYSGFRLGMLSEHPLWLLSPVTLLISIIFFFFGLLGQMIIHLHLYQNHQPHVRLTLGLNPPSSSPATPVTNGPD
ncbi:MAG: glycosyltransferase family 2 protein [Magnetococcales bacterium]|nr:glycosyltransferase family 2 protein [Magnetococcales bacterium]